ncbi:MAG TPA: putative quinol monooxygenase [Candidatus Dormibacteraeota bacterium]|nr:putative quinol monooxygenase [Candidatus Dormibacteraeota bacterium]
MPTPLTVIARVRAKPGQEVALRAALIALVARTRSEAGCLNYDLHESLDDPAQYVFYENWTSRQALDSHSRSAHILAFRELAKDLLSGPTEISLWKRVE